MKIIEKKLVSIPKLTKKAQDVFNAWVRKRDKNKGCISCGSAKVEHAGHYFHAGHYSALRFSEMNCNGQCVQCNYHKHGNQIGYRRGLVERYGEGNVKLLENSVTIRTVKKWSRFELETIIKMYK